MILQIIVNEKGRAADITVLSPIGFGLDERAQEAVERWEFAPATKDGHPVRVLATVEVNFRLLGVAFDEKSEQRRTQFNLAAQTLNRAGASDRDVEQAIGTILNLSQQKLPAAMYQEGMWKAKGDRLPRNPEEGWALIEKAAAKNYGPAIYEIGIRRIEGIDLAKNEEKGLGELREAATLGSIQAQFYLGDRYQKGSGVPIDLDRARRYFRLCSAQGVSVCQYRLAKLLLEKKDRAERDYVQAVALLQLAADGGLKEARDVAAKEAADLTPSQSKWVQGLKAQLVRK